MRSQADPFRRLYDTNRERIHGLLARMVGAQEAEDLTQAVFAKAARALPSFRSEAQVSTWLYRIAANVACDWLRGRPAQEAKLTAGPPDAPESAEFADRQPSPEQEFVRKQIADNIRAEIGRLPAPHREVLMLGQLGGLSDEELAATLGITPGNAKVRLHRARVALKQAIGARCDFYRLEMSCAPNTPTCCVPETAAADGKPTR